MLGDADSTEGSDNERSYTPPPMNSNKRAGLPDPSIESLPKKIHLDDDGSLTPDLDNDNSSKTDIDAKVQKFKNEKGIVQSKIDNPSEHDIEFSDNNSQGDEQENNEEEDSIYSPSTTSKSLQLSKNDSLQLDTSKISIPSNLQEILNNIKVNKNDSNEDIKSDSDDNTVNSKLINRVAEAVKDCDFEPLLKQQRLFHSVEDVDDRLLKPVNIPMEPFGGCDQDLRYRDPRISKIPPEMSEAEFRAKTIAMETSNSHKMARPSGNPVFNPPLPPPPPPPSFIAHQLPHPSGFSGPPVQPNFNQHQSNELPNRLMHNHPDPFHNMSDGPISNHHGMVGNRGPSNRHGHHENPDRRVLGHQGHINGPPEPRSSMSDHPIGGPHSPISHDRHMPDRDNYDRPHGPGFHSYRGNRYEPPLPSNRHMGSSHSRQIDDHRESPPYRIEPQMNDVHYRPTARYPQPNKGQERRYPDDRYNKRWESWGDDHQWNGNGRRPDNHRDYRNYKDNGRGPDKYSRDNRRWENRKPNYRDNLS